MSKGKEGTFMKQFEEPKLEVTMFVAEDIVTTSGDGDNFFDNPCVM